MYLKSLGPVLHERFVLGEHFAVENLNAHIKLGLGVGQTLEGVEDNLTSEMK